MHTLLEPQKHIPVIDEADICVLGGGCTGVFAAVRAARLGAKVIIVEKQNCFGGVATCAMVNNWHSIWDMDFDRQIIAGLTWEVIERLKLREAVEIHNKDWNAFKLNSEELKIELDQLICEAKVKPYLHTFFSAPFCEEGQLTHIIVENKSGRGAIKSKIFIDATGDGDLCVRLGLENYTRDKLQPPTMVGRIHGIPSMDGFNLREAINAHYSEFGLERDWGFSMAIPGLREIKAHAETHVFRVNCSNAQDLTSSEIQGRRHIRAIMDIVRKYGPKDKKAVLLGLASTIGIRETRHIKSLYPLSQRDLLSGKKFEDAIANGSYPVDIHYSDKPGVELKYLDGREIINDGTNTVMRRWKKERGNYPKYWQLPYRALLNGRFNNVLMCGRMLDADEGAYGAIRVMVNLNQAGEAAGVAAYISLLTGKDVHEIDTCLLRRLLKDGGAIVL